MTTSRADLYRLIDQIGEHDLDRVRRFLEELAAGVHVNLSAAPSGDEPEVNAEREALADLANEPKRD